MFLLFLFALDKVPVLVGELAQRILIKSTRYSDTEQVSRQRIENTRAALADIIEVDAETAQAEAE